LLKLFSNFSNLQEHYVVWEDFQNIFAFYNKSQVTQLFTTTDRSLDLAADYSIAIKFPEYDELVKHNRKINFRSSVMDYTLADVSSLGLPKDFICICPITTTEKSDRNFQDRDWNEILEYLRRTDQMGVVLNMSNDPIPEHRHLINLTNRTNLPESIEVLKLSKGYIGIDSCLSVIAAQLFSSQNLMIKSINEHLFRWKHIYYGSHTSFDFIVSDFKQLINR
jgi:ADP-heptose:LPS heptosyltransferase